MTETNNTRRRPAQERSKKRVDAILAAAKALISEKGSARLKIHEIAERAKVTPASIYQYFPNKNAITQALAESIFSRAHDELVGNLPKIDSKDQLYGMLRQLVEQYYQIYLDDPALLDVWHSIATDKSTKALDLEDSRRNADLIFEYMKQFYDESDWPKISSVAFLLAHLAGAAVRMALSVGDQEGRMLVDNFKKIISPTFVDTMLKEQGQG